MGPPDKPGDDVSYGAACGVSGVGCMIRVLGVLAAAVCLAGGALAAPAQPTPDAPELAALGPYKVGVHTIVLTQAAQPDVLDPAAAKGAAPLKDRRLPVEIWYPARPAAGAKAVVYRTELSGERPGSLVAFTIPGLAVRDAPAVRGGFPLVIVSHGYANTPAVMSWLGEALASKGYVVAAIGHGDPDYSNSRGFPGPVMRRPLDIAFVARTLGARIRAGDPTLVGADASRVALVGYSMGGYGVLTVGGASLDPKAAAMVPGGYLTPFARGGARQGELAIPGLKAVVAIAPAGMRMSAWGAEGLAGLRSPLMLIGGDADTTVGFKDGIVPIFDGAVNAPRYLLVYQNGGHALGLVPAPPQANRALWDFQWFEDPVWRKDRILGINAHFITAFLDRYAKGDESRAAYLDSDVALGGGGTWPAAAKGYGAISPGGAGATWKGFHRGTALGLELRRRAAGS